MKQQRWEESEKRKRRKIREEKGRRKKKKEDQSAREGRKVAKACVLPMFCGYGGSKSRLAKAAGAEPFCGSRGESRCCFRCLPLPLLFLHCI